MSNKAEYSWTIKAKTIFPIILLGFCILLFFVGFEYHLRARQLPQITAVVTAVLLIAHLFTEFREKKTESKESRPMPEANRRALIWTLVASPIYIVGLQYLGFLIASFILVLALMIILGVRKTSLIIGVPAISTLLLYVVFKVLLNVPIPMGSLFSVFLG